MSGIEVHEIRSRLNLTQVELAEKIGVSQVAISLWESGKRNPRGPVVLLLKQLKGAGAERKPAETGRKQGNSHKRPVR